MKKPAKGLEEKYLKALREIHQSLAFNEKACIAKITKKHKVTHRIATAIRKMGIIRYTVSGNRWYGDAPNMQMVSEIRAFLYNYKHISKETQQQLFEWAKPETTVKIEPKYEFTPQPDSSLVSEFIDHHEQSLLPHVQSNVKTAENIKIERLFQLRIFGINLFTIKY